MESEDDCMKRVKKAIKNARPTNPLAAQAGKDGDPSKARPKPDHRDSHDADRRDHKSHHHRDERPPI
jgi:hypothetical protein